MKWKAVTREAKLLLIGIPVFIWTMIPIYHLFLFAISERDSATSGRLWPRNPTLQNFEFVFQQKHFYLNYFWLQMWNSVLIAVSVGAITLFVATLVRQRIVISEVVPICRYGPRVTVCAEASKPSAVVINVNASVDQVVTHQRRSGKFLKRIMTAT